MIWFYWSVSVLYEIIVDRYKILSDIYLYFSLSVCFAFEFFRQIKEWAKAKAINDPKNGTLNSYSLCLLVIFHFQVTFFLFKEV